MWARGGGEWRAVVGGGGEWRAGRGRGGGRRCPRANLCGQAGGWSGASGGAQANRASISTSASTQSAPPAVGQCAGRVIGPGERPGATERREQGMPTIRTLFPKQAARLWSSMMCGRGRVCVHESTCHNLRRAGLCRGKNLQLQRCCACWHDSMMPTRQARRRLCQRGEGQVKNTSLRRSGASTNGSGGLTGFRCLRECVTGLVRGKVAGGY